MSIVHEKYKQLKPELRYLADEVVLAQAWKKSHTYIRSHNWYADTLELDCSSINLQARLKSWAKELKDDSYHPADMRLVPAPKADRWTYFEDPPQSGQWKWGPEPKTDECPPDGTPISESKELRPLAHLNIQDQTVATAIMLCLADAVETVQGSTDPELEHQVCSYGNRLFCDWEAKQARFRWGNSDTYSKYFQDYQRFLERPLRKAQELQHQLSPTDGIYEIHLDFSAFYDSIDRARLINVLRNLAKGHYEIDQKEGTKFWGAVKRIIQGWKWAEEDSQLAGCLKDGKLPEGKGVPQGLVASGFFANAYLLGLDQEMHKRINEDIQNVTLVDYCRYVDDIRLLVWVPESKVPDDWKGWVKEHIEPMIEKKGLALNPQKTKIERYTAKRSGVSVRMKAIQQAVSGPLDGPALSQMIRSLEGLFSLAEQMRDQSDLSYRACNLPLARVDQPQMDVREDTVMRFAANRIAKALKDKRRLSEQDVPENDAFSELDHVHESIARRFVGVWSRNPSLLAILNHGFNLFPHPFLLRPVCDALLLKLKGSEAQAERNHERRIALYCFSEIFRFVALDLHRQRSDEHPAHADWDGFMNLMTHYGRYLLGEPDKLFPGKESLPWYTRQQILLFLAISGDIGEPLLKDEQDDYWLLHCILRGDRLFKARDALEKQVPLFVVAYQISHHKDRIVASLCDWLGWMQQNRRNRLLRRVLESLALNHSELFEKVRSHGGRTYGDKWCTEMAAIARQYGLDYESLPGELCRYNGKTVPLARVLMRADNPFAHENALLTLVKAILLWEDAWTDGRLMAPHRLRINCKDWEKLQTAEAGKNLIKLEWVQEAKEAEVDHRYEPPSWLSDGEDNLRLYSLGSFLRACVTGDMDFTTGIYLVREETGPAYFGLKSSWFKRSMGMAHRPEVLVGEAAPMSSWISELLYRLLQWPGLEVRNRTVEWPSRLTLKGLEMVIKDRLKAQKRLYGRASLLPVYIEHIRHELRDNQHFKVVMVQSLIPRMHDFESAGIKLDAADFRLRHRGHVAAMSKLVLDKLNTVKAADGKIADKSAADLIIFPELAVHSRDIDLLKQLGDKTGAMIYAGLVYHERRDQLVNAALWLIPFKNGGRRQWITRLQGKQHMTKDETKLGIKAWRPYQLVIELENTLEGMEHGFRLSGAICYDATDISLAADLRDVSNAFVVIAMNRDIDTFDTMVDALHYHMFQPVILVNTGEFGGSVAKAPYKRKYHKLIAHAHGSNQIAISMFDLNIHDFLSRPSPPGSEKEVKNRPAGLNRMK